MSETSLNEKIALNTISKSNVDLKVDNGNIVDSNGNPVIIGKIDNNEKEQSFGVTNRGVTKVKGSSPTGDFRSDTNGNIVVDGYGTVALEGPLREVSSVGNTNGEAQSIKVDSSNTPYIEWTESGTDEPSLSKYTIGNTDTALFDLNFVSRDPNDCSNFKVTNAHIYWDEGGEETGDTYSIDFRHNIYWTQNAYENNNPDYTVDTKLSFTRDGLGHRAWPWDGPSEINAPTGYDGNGVAELKPITDSDGDGQNEYFSGPGWDDGGISVDEWDVWTQFNWEEYYNPSVSFY